MEQQEDRKKTASSDDRHEEERDDDEEDPAEVRSLGVDPLHSPVPGRVHAVIKDSESQSSSEIDLLPRACLYSFFGKNLPRR